MTATQRDAVVDVQREIGKQRCGQDVVGLQLLFLTTDTTHTVPFNNSFLPLLSIPNMPKRLFRLAVNKIGIAFSLVACRYYLTLAFAALTAFGTVGAVTLSIISAFAQLTATTTGFYLDRSPKQGFVYPEQCPLKLSDGACIAFKIFGRLSVGAKAARWQGKHSAHFVTTGYATKLFADSASTPAAVVIS